MNYAATSALALVLSLVAGPTIAADAPAKAVTPQQQRMKDCNTQATGKHGDERKAFMSACLKGGSSTAGTSVDGSRGAQARRLEVEEQSCLRQALNGSRGMPSPGRWPGPAPAFHSVHVAGVNSRCFPPQPSGDPP